MTTARAVMTVLNGPNPTQASTSGAAATASDDVVAEADLAAFLAYWRKLLAGDAWPRRADLDPVAIPRLLPHVMITKLTPDGRDRVRLAGTRIVDHLGFDPTGSDLHDDRDGRRFTDMCRRLNRHMYQAGAPIYAAGRHVSALGAARESREVVCPLSDSGDRADAAVRCVVFLGSNDPTAGRRDPAGEIVFVHPLALAA
ncbi:PAS domain-containing protein [Limimonas halophila]|nr:PAS domain-containing protein [Limimonas halophila]